MTVDKIRSASGWVDNRLRMENYPGINIVDFAEAPFYQTIYTMAPDERCLGFLGGSYVAPDTCSLGVYVGGQWMGRLLDWDRNEVQNTFPATEMLGGDVVLRLMNGEFHTVVPDGWSPYFQYENFTTPDTNGSAICTVNPDPEGDFDARFWYVDNNATGGPGGGQILTHRIVDQGSYTWADDTFFDLVDPSGSEFAQFQVSALDGGGNITSYSMIYSDYGFVPGFYTVREADTATICDMVFEVLSTTPFGTEPDWWDADRMVRGNCYDGGAWFSIGQALPTVGSSDLHLICASVE